MSRQSPPGESDRGRIARGPSRVTCQPHCADIRLDYLMMSILTRSALTATPSMLSISRVPLMFSFVVERTNLRPVGVSLSRTVPFRPGATLAFPRANKRWGAFTIAPSRVRSAFLVTINLTSLVHDAPGAFAMTQVTGTEHLRGPHRTRFLRLKDWDGRASTDIGTAPREVVISARVASGATSHASTETLSAGPKTGPS